jgi:hypothetical protein
VEYQGQQFIFEAGARLDGGGMAEVYYGTRKDDPAVRVAIRIPLPELPPSAQAVFLPEAEAASQVSSSQVVRVVDWGDQPSFIAYEFIDCITLTLRQRLRETNRRLRVTAWMAPGQETPLQKPLEGRFVHERGWLPDLDSNQDYLIQSQACYRCTIRQGTQKV